MTDLTSHSARAEVPELILILRNERPISAKDLGALFSALATDYGRINRGRTLVVVGLESGSIIVHLQEAVATIAPYAMTAWELANAAKNLKGFLEILRDLFWKAKEDPQKVPLFQKKRSPPGIKSIEAMITTTINAGGEAEIRHTGEEIAVRLVSPEAVKIREQAEISARELSRPPNQRDMEFMDEIVGSGYYDPGRLAYRLVAAGPDAEALVEALTSALKEAGLAYVLETVAAKLDEGGHHPLAAAVRASLYRGHRASEPPERS